MALGMTYSKTFTVSDDECVTVTMIERRNVAYHAPTMTVTRDGQPIGWREGRRIVSTFDEWAEFGMVFCGMKWDKDKFILGEQWTDTYDDPADGSLGARYCFNNFDVVVDVTKAR